MAAERKTLTQLSVPICLETLFYMLSGMVDTLMLSSVSDQAVGAVGTANTYIGVFYYYVWSNIVGYDSCYVTKYRSWKTGDSISGKATWTYIQRIDRYRNVCRSCYFFWWDT